MDREVTLLAVGDMHLGRRPARVPDDLALAGVDPAALSPAAAWAAVVERALAERVDAVLLAGDVVEAPDDFFEAYTLLDRGVRRLVDAGIPVLAVAGNHDVAVLPRLADAIPAFRLLGRGGRWEAASVERDGRAVLRVLGWSFPAARVERSPLQGLAPFDGPAIPTIGLLHCDVGGAASGYAPVQRAELERVPVQGWLLGHIHAPDDLSGARPIGYLGSLVGLDPGERGRRGPWRITVADGAVRAEHLPIAPLRWEVAEVDAGTLPDVGALEGAIVAAFDRVHATLAAAEGLPRAVGLRVRITGSHALGRRLAEAQAGLDLTALRPQRDGTTYFLERLADESRPALALAALAAGADPAGLLARRLLLLDGPDGPERRTLLARGRARLEREAARAPFQALGAGPLDDAVVAAWLVRAGRIALDMLLAQREGQP